MDVLTTLLLIAFGIGVSEVYHARMETLAKAHRISQRAIAARPPVPRPNFNYRGKPPLDQLIRMPAYPAPAAKLYKPADKVINLQEWHYQQSLRKHTQRWPLREGRAG